MLFSFIGVAITVMQVGAVAITALFAFTIFNNLTQPKSEENTANTNSSMVKVAATATDTTVNNNLSVKLSESNVDNKSATTTTPSPELAIKTDKKNQTTTPEERRVENWDWLLKQNASHFTVQYASSTLQQLLREDARTFPTDDPSAIYPFRRSKRDKLIYGFSVGLYATRADAEKAIAKTPKSANTNKPWIRQVGTIQNQITRTLAGE